MAQPISMVITSLFWLTQQSQIPPLRRKAKASPTILSVRDRQEINGEQPTLTCTSNRILSKVQKSFWSCTHVNSFQKYALYVNLHILLNI